MNKIVIKGRILQIITPNKHRDYLLPMFPHNKESPLYGFYYLKVTETNIPVDTFNSFFKRIIWKLTNKENKDKTTHIIVMRECPYIVGETVEFEVERYLEPTEIFIKTKE